jgi:hypothetical protein
MEYESVFEMATSAHEVAVVDDSDSVEDRSNSSLIRII